MDISRFTAIPYPNDTFAAHDLLSWSKFSANVLRALNRLDPSEIYIGRGAPHQYSMLFMGFDGNGIRLGYCGDFVEMQLSGPAADAYPAKGGVWEIHNAALTELFAEIVNMPVGSWDTENVDIFGESEIFSYTDMKAAIDIVLEHMKSSDPMAEVTLLQLGYDEELSLREADADAKQYGADEAIVLVSDFEVGESWGAFNPNTTYENWKWILTRNAGGDWILQTMGYG